LQNGGNMEALRRAAAEQQFLELAVRARSLEAMDPRHLEDLDRYRYLEEAA